MTITVEQEIENLRKKYPDAALIHECDGWTIYSESLGETLSEPHVLYHTEAAAWEAAYRRMVAPTHAQVAALAYRIWEIRDEAKPTSLEEAEMNWYEAEGALRTMHG